MKRTLSYLSAFIGFIVLAAFVYRNGFHIPYFYDDYEHVFTHPGFDLFGSFLQANGYAHFYRPLEKILLSVVQMQWGWDTFPIRILHILLHASGALLVFHALRTWKMNTISAAAGAIFMIVSQLCVYAVASNDSQSQLEGALFSALALWLLYRYTNQAHHHVWKYVASVGCFLLALFSKETSAGLLIAIPFVINAQGDSRQPISKRIQKMLLLLTPYAICFLIYWVLRLNAGGSTAAFGATSYSFHFGLNVFRNLGLFFVQAILPVSSLAAARAVYYREYALLTVMLLYTGLFAYFFICGLLRSPRRNLVIGLSVLAFCSWCPALFLGWMNELYPYNSIPIIAALFGISAEYYLSSRKTPFIRSAAMLLFLGVLITNAIGTNEKTMGMSELGSRAEAFLPQVISSAKELPEHETLYLVNPDGPTFEYSQFSMRGFRVVAGCDSLVRYYATRPDFQYFIS
ncbi:MAG: hypothetical protein Q8919_13230, partial [Bacteroidota bacterium]|nr:hypothetical protein [Bacteroidota bacterium]